MLLETIEILVFRKIENSMSQILYPQILYIMFKVPIFFKSMIKIVKF